MRQSNLWFGSGQFLQKQQSHRRVLLASG